MFLFYLIYLRDFIHYIKLLHYILYSYLFGLFYQHRRSSATPSEKGGSRWLVWSLTSWGWRTSTWVWPGEPGGRAFWEYVFRAVSAVMYYSKKTQFSRNWIPSAKKEKIKWAFDEVLRCAWVVQEGFVPVPVVTAVEPVGVRPEEGVGNPPHLFYFFLEC